jgi:hypothetical protein
LASEIEDHLPALEANFTGKEVDFVIPLGDNWLYAWEWAKMLERDHGIDHQAALRVAHDRYFKGRNGISRTTD